MDRIAYNGLFADIGASSSLRILSQVLTEYAVNDKSLKDFENDYDCKIVYHEQGGICGISCNSEASRTLLELKYAK